MRVSLLACAWQVHETNHCQGVLYLNDRGADGGGFRCVPGFAKRWREVRSPSPTARPDSAVTVRLGFVPSVP